MDEVDTAFEKACSTVEASPPVEETAPADPQITINKLVQENSNLRACLGILPNRQGGNVLLNNKELQRIEGKDVPSIQWKQELDGIRVKVN